MYLALKEIELQIFDQLARISADDPTILGKISACFSAFLRPIRDLDGTVIDLTILSRLTGSEWSVSHGGNSVICRELAELLYVVEKTLTTELQHRRPELFFLHAAAVSANGRCVVISGDSGAGKSTLCWDLCHAGFKYMSDELAPINLDTMQVAAYPHAICLKRITAHMPGLPIETIRTESTMHIPAEAVPGGVERKPATVEMIVFVEKSGISAASGLMKIPQSEAAARLYSNGLNQLAHEHDGLRAATKLSGAVDCFTLVRGDLSDMKIALMRGLGL